jgi:type IV pilus assembly protein PilE
MSRVKTTNSRSRSQPGFTIIELLAAVVIVGILVALALPSYRETVARSRRADARVALGGLAVAMERFYTGLTTAQVTTSGYALAVGASNAPLASVFASAVPIDGSATSPKFYNLLITDASTTAFTLQAVPTGRQAGDRCGTFTLTSTGVRALIINQSPIAPTDARVADCWR